MDGKGLTCTTRDWQTPNRIDSCRNQAITTHDSGLAGLGSGGVTGHSEVIPSYRTRLPETGPPVDLCPFAPNLATGTMAARPMTKDGNIGG